MRANFSLLRSWHFACAAAIAAGTWAAFFLADARPGRQPGSSRFLLLFTGWLAAALFAVVMAYVLRKYMHKLRYSPELRRPVAMSALERGESRLDGVREQVLRGTLTDPRTIKAAAARVLREERVHRVLRAEVRRGTGPGPAWTIRALPTEPFGRVRAWLHVHLWYGLASALVIWLHGGLELGTPTGAALNGLSAAVLVTGTIGIVLWALGPAWMTRSERRFGTTIEKAHSLSRSFTTKLDRALVELDDDLRAVMDDVRSDPFDPARAEAALAALERSGSDPSVVERAQELLALVGQKGRIDHALARLRAVRNSFMLWRIVHVPLAWLLVGLVVIHAFSIWVY